MKVIRIHRTQRSTIQKAIQQDREAQKKIFEQFSPKMLFVCRQYVRDNHHAEELMLSGFFKVFTQLHKFKHTGSFEGWIRRIMVNTCLTYLRKKTSMTTTDQDYANHPHVTESLENTSVQELQWLIDRLPEGYKMVFHLYAIEGYKHAEIAKQLNITVSTSKSQLFKARKWLQENYKKMNQISSDGK